MAGSVDDQRIGAGELGQECGEGVRGTGEAFLGRGKRTGLSVYNRALSALLAAISLALVIPRHTQVVFTQVMETRSQLGGGGVMRSPGPQ